MPPKPCNRVTFMHFGHINTTWFPFHRYKLDVRQPYKQRCIKIFCLLREVHFHPYPEDRLSFSWSLGVHKFYPSIYGYFRVLLGTSEYFWVLPGTSGYLRVLPGTSGYFRVLPGTFGYFKVLLGTTGYYRVLLGTSGYFWVLLDLSAYFWSVQISSDSNHQSR